MNRFLGIVSSLLFAGLILTGSVQAGTFDLYYWTDATADHQVGNVNNWAADYHSGATFTSPADAVPGDGDIAMFTLPGSTAQINATSNFTGGLINELYVGEGTVSGWPFTPSPGPGHLAVRDTTLNYRYWMNVGRMVGPTGGTSTLDFYNAVFNDADPGGRNVVGERSVAAITLNDNSRWDTRDWTIVGWTERANGSVTLNDSTWNCLTNDITIGYFGVADNAATAATGTVTLNGASVLDATGHGIVVGAENGSGTLNLNGTSTAKVNWLNTYSHASQSSTVNFDGGTLAVTADNANLLGQGSAATPHVYVKAGGAKIDTGLFAVALWEPLEADSGSPGGGLEKLGLGKLTLSGASNYTGDTNVTAGTLSVTGSLTSDVAVAADAVLMGTGTINGDVTVDGGSGGGALAPGTSIGQLNVVGDATIAGTLDVEYNSDDGSCDLLAVTGQLDLTGGTLHFTDRGSAGLGGPYVVATYGTLVGTPIEEGVPLGWSVDYALGGNKVIALVAVPEPAMLCLILSLGLALAGCRARK